MRFYTEENQRRKEIQVTMKQEGDDVNFFLDGELMFYLDGDYDNLYLCSEKLRDVGLKVEGH